MTGFGVNEMFSDVKKRDLMENKGSYGKQMYFM
jgi:hypothetical protein